MFKKASSAPQTREVDCITHLFTKKANIKRQLKDCKILSCKIPKRGNKIENKTKKHYQPIKCHFFHTIEGRVCMLDDLSSRTEASLCRPLQGISYIVFLGFCYLFFCLYLNLLQLLLSFELNKCYAFFSRFSRFSKLLPVAYKFCYKPILLIYSSVDCMNHKYQPMQSANPTCCFFIL